MLRRSFAKTTAGTVLLTTVPSWLKLIKAHPYDMTLIRRNVGFFTEKGGTIGWLIQKDNVIVIDAQFPDTATHLIEEIKKKETGAIRYLINTHHHGDHTAGNIAFRGIARNILAQENSRTNQMNSAKKNNNENDQLYPDMVFDKQWQEKIGDEIIDIQYWGPAHTNGDSIIHFQNANVVHCGDLMFNRRYPYIDKSAGARIDNWIEILQRMQSHYDNDSIFIFGHAQAGYNVTGNKDDLAAFADYLMALLEFVSAEIKAGKSKEQIMAATCIPGATQWTGDGIERSLTAALEELGY